MAKPGIMILKKGREKPLLNGHPWVFSGAVDTTRSNFEGIEPGDVLEIRGQDGGFLARGYVNRQSQIVARVLTWDQTEAIGPAWWRIRLAQAISGRTELAAREDTNTYRLVNAENDGLPGLIVDRYGDVLVMQALTMGIEVNKEVIVEALVALLNPVAVVERSDTDARGKEGLPDSVGVMYGDLPDMPLTVSEYGVLYPVDVLHGHKTGFYLDQREARDWLRTSPEVAGKSILNCFSYTGAFAACAALNGAAEITVVDSSEPSIEISRETMRLNNVEDVPYETVVADVFEQLRTYRDEDRTFDLIILDPPKFAHSSRQVDAATRGYKDINLLAFSLLNPGGLLLTFSCSGLVSPDLFQKVVFGASIDADVTAQIVGWFNQPSDHPVALTFPEGHYLKGLACRITG